MEYKYPVQKPLAIIRMTSDWIAEASMLLALHIEGDHYSEDLFEKCNQALERLIGFDSAELYLVKNADACIGFVLINWGFSTTTGWPILRIQDLFILQSSRREGAGTLLLEHCIHLVKLQGANRIQLDTNVMNTAARSFYEQAGFECFPEKLIYMKFIHET
ncbi:GNAT family N-acetyltransferase [Paenibacillus spongiae]|uniref:GNAT family N-acetyltransferase n=1 Tax=Paenibacillus spongiae TaxID=2909671 RepID=A0ABY5SGL7_9BACL|nr:GNAT family N-acetyltransferase [Paenibacillus spongiae]UVI33141.1 GNAT family N-acetyltransferase [Paenibacillus spongiae]